MDFHTYSSVGKDLWKEPFYDGRRWMKFETILDWYDFHAAQEAANFHIAFFESFDTTKEYCKSSSCMYFLDTERRWWDESRPYFKVWPSIMGSLTKIKLDICPEDFAIPKMVVAMRFAKQHEPAVCSYKIKALLIGSYRDGCDDENFCMVLRLACNVLRAGSMDEELLILPPMRFMEKRTLEWFLENIAASDLPHDITRVEFKDLTAACLRIAISLLLLAQDPSIIQPDVLAADRQRFDESSDPEECKRLIDKAARKGIVGWRVGESYETIPHFRRPHFALRHTGAGRTIPRIVPIKGSVVHRQKLTDVPTGYMTPDGIEIEP